MVNGHLPCWTFNVAPARLGDYVMRSTEGKTSRLLHFLASPRTCASRIATGRCRVRGQPRMADSHNCPSTAQPHARAAKPSSATSYHECECEYVPSHGHGGSTATGVRARRPRNQDNQQSPAARACPPAGTSCAVHQELLEALFLHRHLSSRGITRIFIVARSLAGLTPAHRLS